MIQSLLQRLQSTIIYNVQRFKNDGILRSAGRIYYYALALFSLNSLVQATLTVNLLSLSTLLWTNVIASDAEERRIQETSDRFTTSTQTAISNREGTPTGAATATVVSKNYCAQSNKTHRSNRPRGLVVLVYCLLLFIHAVAKRARGLSSQRHRYSFTFLRISSGVSLSLFVLNSSMFVFGALAKLLVACVTQAHFFLFLGRTHIGLLVSVW